MGTDDACSLALSFASYRLFPAIGGNIPATPSPKEFPALARTQARCSQSFRRSCNERSCSKAKTFLRRRTAVLRQLPRFSFAGAAPRRANCGAISSMISSTVSTSFAPWRISRCAPRLRLEPDFTGHGEHFAPLIHGQRRGNQRTAFLGRLDHHDAQRQAR